MTTQNDPRKMMGSIVGPGGSHDRNGVVIDATKAVLMDSAIVALAEARPTDGTRLDQPVWVLNLGGRINKSTDRADINFIFEVDGAAAIITELMALASRSGAGELLDAAMDRRLDRLELNGDL